ncbi:hypothetical protein BJ875DRAFT_105796 [Amylocarpus encephaloides]|uniref:Extracellular membrane protein CFEM domain-containing protein n=1 Tax=Amylocarpus encephaloides TaxID=45428 RepID=A0A9P7YDS3_9HELO|nr:hypothetical protein BJ875DRAFT_105796 [Amylocarpus encephaloides]
MQISSYVILLNVVSLCVAKTSHELGGRQVPPGIDQVPQCAIPCILTLTPKFCGLVTNTTCICNSSELVDAMIPCTYAACNITESIRLERYQKDSCGVKNDKSRQEFYTHEVYILVSLASLVVAIRCYSRIKLDIGMGADDWAMVAALSTYIIESGTSIGITNNKFGQHLYYLTTREVMIALKYFYITEIFFLLSIMLIKVSILLFFIRIFPGGNHRKMIWGLMALLLITHMTSVCTAIFQCVPFRGNWENWMYKSPPVKCINVYAAILASAGSSLALDILILVFPIPILWKLKLAWNKKIQLLLIFSVGIFVVICACARIPTLKLMKASRDPSWDQQPVAVWSGLEAVTGIICGSLPACRSLAAYFFPRLKVFLGSSENEFTPRRTSRDEEESTGKRKKNRITVTTTTTMGSFMQLDDVSRIGVANANVSERFEHVGTVVKTGGV